MTSTIDTKMAFFEGYYTDEIERYTARRTGLIENIMSNLQSPDGASYLIDRHKDIEMASKCEGKIAILTAIVDDMKARNADMPKARKTAKNVLNKGVWENNMALVDAAKDGMEEIAEIAASFTKASA
jgi:hypothetical protein